MVEEVKKEYVFSTSQILNYYPKYAYLDELISLTGHKKLNLFIDLKGCMQSLYQEWAVRYIISQSQKVRSVDTSIFSAFLEFTAFHKTYAKKRSLDLKMYFFMESGESQYHKNLLKTYKDNRKMSDMFGLDNASKDLFFKAINKNLTVVEKAGNKIPNVSVIRFGFMEADFIPWYLLNRCLDTTDCTNVIYSTDKDMLQCLDKKDTYQYFRHFNMQKMISQKDMYKHFLKVEDFSNVSAVWFPLILSILGDGADNIPKVQGIGPVAMTKCFNELMILCKNSMDTVYESVKNKTTIFDRSYNPSNNVLKKILDHEELIVNNLKLISFKLLADYLDNDYPLDVIEKKKYVHEVLNNTNKIPNPSVLFDALEKSGLGDMLNEGVLVNLF